MCLDLIAISGVAAAIALKAVFEKHEIPGTVKLFGTPAEGYYYYLCAITMSHYVETKYAHKVNYLQKKFSTLKWKNKLLLLNDIATGLKIIHEAIHEALKALKDPSPIDLANKVYDVLFERLKENIAE